MNFFERLKKQYYHTDPVEHIIGPQIIKVAEYDDLYENQTRFDGTVWKKFKKKQNLKCVFHEDLRDIDRSVDIIKNQVKKELRKENLKNRIFDKEGILLQWKADKRSTFIWRHKNTDGKITEKTCAHGTLKNRISKLVKIGVIS